MESFPVCPGDSPVSSSLVIFLRIGVRRETEDLRPAARDLHVKSCHETDAAHWVRTLQMRRRELRAFLHKSMKGCRQGRWNDFGVCIEVDTPFMDYIGCYIGNSHVSTKCEVDTALSWLSTLGGACSALGDLSVQFAQVAGQISMKQLRLAMKLGDPLVASRCRIYAALSLMQIGDLKSSRKILLAEYKYALRVGESLDPKLRRMCLGSWSKLQYLWRNSCKRRRIENDCGDDSGRNKKIALSNCVLASITLARDNSDFLIPSAVKKASECG